MNAITITTEIAKEINKSIEAFEKMITKENAISEDLRYNHKIEKWTNKVNELKAALINGKI